MSYLVCDKCGGYYMLQPGESPEDFSNECECGGKLKFVKNLKPVGSSTTGFWDKLSNKMKIGIVMGGICCIGLIFILIFCGMFSNASIMTSEQIKQNATAVTPETLYNDQGTLVGKAVKFSGEVYTSDRGDVLVVKPNSEGEGYQNWMGIIVRGDTSTLNNSNKEIFEVYGIYNGRIDYIKNWGGEKEMPLVEQAIFVPTGKKSA